MKRLVIAMVCTLSVIAAMSQPMSSQQAKAYIVQLVKDTQSSLPSTNHSKRIWYECTYTNNVITMKYVLQSNDYKEVMQPFQNGMGIKEEEYLACVYRYEDLKFFVGYCRLVPAAYEAFNKSGVTIISKVYNATKTKLLTSFNFKYSDMKCLKKMEEDGMSMVQIMGLYGHEIGFKKGFELAASKVPYMVATNEYVYEQSLKDKLLTYKIAVPSEHYKVMKLTGEKQTKNKVMGQICEIYENEPRTIYLFKYLGYRIKNIYTDTDNPQSNNITITISDKELMDYINCK